MAGSMRTFEDRQTDGQTEANLKDQSVGPKTDRHALRIILVPSTIQQTKYDGF